MNRPDDAKKYIDVAIVCTNCGQATLFRIGGSNPSIDRDSVKGRCDRCGKELSAKGGTATVVVSEVIDILTQAPDPLRKAKEMLAALGELQRTKDIAAARRAGKLAKLKGLAVSKKGQATVYAGLIVVLVKLWLAKGGNAKESPPPTQTIVNVYNQSVDLRKK
jgi:hypothetical protein